MRELGLGLGEDVPSIVHRVRERVREFGRVREETGVPDADGRADREERVRRRRDRQVLAVEPFFTVVELADHEADRGVEVLQRPVRPVQETARVSEEDDVLAHQRAVRAACEGADPLRRLDTRVEQPRFDELAVTACDFVDRPGRQAAAYGRCEVGAVRRHRVHVPRDVHRSGLGRLRLDEAERPGGGPGRSCSWAGRHPAVGGTTSSLGRGVQSHSAHTSPVSR